MERSSIWLICAALVVLAMSCSRADQRRVDQKTAEAEAKLKRGGAELREAGGKAAAKMDQASVITKVKAKLASDVGLATATAVDVDVKDDVVTLRGKVRSEEQKRQAEQLAKEVNGVTKVVNELKVTN